MKKQPDTRSDYESLGPSVGVQELIDQLRTEGAEAGEKAAQRIIEEARSEAARLVSDARMQAEKLRERTHRELVGEKAAAREALQLAARDTILRFKTEMIGHFQADLQRLVRRELEDEAVLRDLLVAAAGHAAPDATALEKIHVLIGRNTSERSEERLKDLIAEIVKGGLRAGIELHRESGEHRGVRVLLAGGEAQIDLTDEGISELLLKHLLPRYRHMLDGIGT